MSVESVKLKLSLEKFRPGSTHEELWQYAMDLAETIGAMSMDRGWPKNYCVVHDQGEHGYWSAESGTKDYCIGYIAGNDRLHEGNAYVVCGEFVCWPEDKFGMILDLSKVRP